MENIRQLFNKKIEESGIKQNYICQKTGISPDALSKMLNGTRRISADEFLKLCNILNVSNKEIQQLKASA